MTDYPKALAAARDALDNHDYGHEIPAYVVRDLLAALDAARGQAARSELRFYQSILTPPRWSPWMEDSDAEQWAEEMRAKGRQVEVRHLYAAPPAAPRVERYGEGVLVHWPEGVEQYVAVGDCVTAPSAAAVPADVEALALRLESTETTDSDCLDAAAMLRAMPTQAPPAGAVPPPEPMPVESECESVEAFVAQRGFAKGWNAYRAAMLAQQPAAAVPADNVTPMRQPRADLTRLVESINAAVYANGNGLSVTEAIGALELAKLELLKEQEQ